MIQSSGFDSPGPSPVRVLLEQVDLPEKPVRALLQLSLLLVRGGEQGHCLGTLGERELGRSRTGPLREGFGEEKNAYFWTFS